jgi:hypothetical protein
MDPAIVVAPWSGKVSKKAERVDNLSRLRKREIMHTEDKYILETQRGEI